MGKRILFLETVHPILAEKLTDMGFECEFNYSISYNDLLNCISRYNGIVLRSRISFDERLIQAGSNLEFIARSGSGLESIDLESCEKHNVKVFSSDKALLKNSPDLKRLLSHTTNTPNVHSVH
jgi:D-3-phosphoglycerate dehydrogenase